MSLSTALTCFPSFYVQVQIVLGVYYVFINVFIMLL